MKSNSNIDIIFLGDTYFGEWHMRRRVRKGKRDVLRAYGYRYFAENFYPLLNEADLVVANLECAITDIPKTPFEGKKLHLYAAAGLGTIDALKAANISAVFLANNLSGDYGKEGLADTLSILSENDIASIGAGRNIQEAEKPFEYSMSCGNEEFRLALLSCYNRVGFSEKHGYYASASEMGVNALDPERIGQQVRQLKKQHNSLFIVAPHWGPNYVWRTPAQRNMAKALIKEGADLILGHSAHMIQEVEYIADKPVIYSLGNFILNGDGEYQQRNLPPYSFISRLNVRPLDDGLDVSLKLYPIQCDNLRTAFQTRFVNEQEFHHVHAIIRSHGYQLDQLEEHYSCGEDEYGLYLRFSL